MTDKQTTANNTPASSLIYGCMGLGGDWEPGECSAQHVKQAHEVIETSLEIGINVFDHADIYTRGKAEQAFGQVLKAQPSLREQMRIQSKCGIRFEDEAGAKRYDFSASWIHHSVDSILARLHIEQLDMLLLHRPDPLMELDETAGALNQLIKQGKIASVGVSNMNLHQMAYLQSALDVPIKANQIEASLDQRNWMEDSIQAGDLEDKHAGFYTGTIEYCKQHNVQLQAWGSLCQGRYTGRPADSQITDNTILLVAQLAEKYQVSKEAIILAWLMRHPANIQPVIGTTNLDRIKACADATRCALSREDWYSLLTTVRGVEVP